jgi:hypothetical protein
MARTSGWFWMLPLQGRDFFRPRPGAASGGCRTCPGLWDKAPLGLKLGFFHMAGGPQAHAVDRVSKASMGPAINPALQAFNPWQSHHPTDQAEGINNLLFTQYSVRNHLTSILKRLVWPYECCQCDRIKKQPECLLGQGSTGPACCYYRSSQAGCDFAEHFRPPGALGIARAGSRWPGGNAKG